MPKNHQCKVLKWIDVWYLDNTALFFDRRLNIGRCHICKKPINTLIEVRKTDNNIFFDTKYGADAEKMAQRCLTQINYTRQDAVCAKGKPYGLCYCNNLITKVNRVDFYGQRETILNR